GVAQRLRRLQGEVEIAGEDEHGALDVLHAVDEGRALLDGGRAWAARMAHRLDAGRGGADAEVALVLVRLLLLELRGEGGAEGDIEPFRVHRLWCGGHGGLTGPDAS